MYRRAPLSLAVLMFALPAAAQFSMKEMTAAKNDPKAYTVDEASIQIAKLGPTVSPTEVTPPDAGGGTDPTVILDQIINIGQKIWKIVVDNRPVVDVKTQYATALPEGAKGWASMGGWQRPKGTIYQLTAKNAYGVQVINLRYQVLRTAGGSYKGTGKYLTAVTVEPLLVEVAWAYHFSMDASVPDTSIVNVGTSENPVAAMTAQLGWHISTPIKDSQGKGLYYMQGDGVYQEIGGPFKNEAVAKMKAAIAKTMGETLPL
ncbi:MAG: hypothetical protein PHS14_16715 [Elusimicrobia bacterium]|nr:hypothetical protein [Elusimicrobiota bacterium]